MATIFYDHLIDWQKLEQALDSLALDKEVRQEYLDEIEHELHTQLLEVALDYLPSQYHETFIVSFHAAPHDPQNLHYLVANGLPNVEAALRERGGKVIAQVIVDLEIT